MANQAQEKLFKSFIIGGFEAAAQRNGARARIDMIASTQHDVQVDSDYALLKSEGILTVRDAARWTLIDRGGEYDFTSLRPIVEAAKKHDMQVIWTLCHYGWPDDIDVFTPEFVTRFARYAEAVAQFIKAETGAVPFYCPINEISFFTWAAAHIGFMHPYQQNRGNEFKHQLVRAAIAGIEAIWSVEPRARIVYVEPVINILTPASRPELADDAARFNELQFEAFDMMAGRLMPELGGQPKYLDIIGANFYETNQWEHEGERLKWWKQKPRDPRWVPLADLLENLQRRYQRPIFLGETSSVGNRRALWIREVADEIVKLRTRGIPFEGICLYPIIDRHEWDDFSHWHNSGLWDFSHEPDGTYRRVINERYAMEVRRADRLCSGAAATVRTVGPAESWARRINSQWVWFKNRKRRRL